MSAFPSARRLLRAAVPVAACLALAAFSGALPPAPAADNPAPREGGGWAEVESLVAAQQFQEALERVQALREKARAAGDEGEWTRTLVEEAKLNLVLGGFETAVRRLRAEPWPTAPLDRAVLDLYYAETLASYLRAYSWEIGERERVAAPPAGAAPGSPAEIDLKAWTAEEIYAEAQRAFLAAWEGRESWGSRPVGTLAAYLDANDYPPRIRGTLRDAVGYLWAELLADRSLWSPAASNDLYRLDLAAVAPATVQSMYAPEFTAYSAGAVLTVAGAPASAD